jgi:hypothetical protein
VGHAEVRSLTPAEGADGEGVGAKAYHTDIQIDRSWGWSRVVRSV